MDEQIQHTSHVLYELSDVHQFDSILQGFKFYLYLYCCCGSTPGLNRLWKWLLMPKHHQQRDYSNKHKHWMQTLVHSMSMSQNYLSM